MIQKLTFADRDAIYDIQTTELAPMGWSRAGVEAIFALKTTLALGVRAEDGALSGFIIVQWVMDEAEILSFAVRAAFQRRGSGSQLWDAMENELKAGGIRKVFLDVAITNKSALAFYQKKGFSIKGKRSHYYTQAEGEKIAALTMSKKL